MSGKESRRPIGNFFIKKSIQVSILVKIGIVVLATTLVTTVLLVAIYNAKSAGGTFYYMSHNIKEDLKLQSILGLVLPAVIAAQVVGTFLAIGVGMFSSRKVAVPLYKIENWARNLKAGKLNTHLAFRETREMRDITDLCNGVSDNFRSIFSEIDGSVRNIEQEIDKPGSVARELSRIRGLLAKLDLGA